MIDINTAAKFYVLLVDRTNKWRALESNVAIGADWQDATNEFDAMCEEAYGVDEWQHAKTMHLLDTSTLKVVNVVNS